MKLLTSLRTKWDGLLAQLASFGVIGALNFVVDTAIFNALFAIGPVKAQIAATLVATTLSYFLNRHWTFRHHERAGLRREYTLFFLLNGVGLAITAGIVGIAKYGFDLHDQWALNAVRLVGIAVATIFRFWSYRRWVFIPSPAPVTGPAGAAVADAGAAVADAPATTHRPATADVASVTAAQYPSTSETRGSVPVQPAGGQRDRRSAVSSSSPR